MYVLNVYMRGYNFSVAFASLCGLFLFRYFPLYRCDRDGKSSIFVLMSIRQLVSSWLSLLTHRGFRSRVYYVLSLFTLESGMACLRTHPSNRNRRSVLRLSHSS